ncbi:MAG: DUF2341 domain-containing protein, partial [Methanoregula sp.]|nr:DUF2341 domain-containing protein [Methanoregula sp.]
MNNEINIENIIEKIITWFKKIFERRFLLYKIGLVFGAVIIIAGGYLIWNMFYGKEASADWYNDSWTRRMKITINADQVAGDLTDFPVLISTTSPALANYAKSDGSDIIFTDFSGTKLHREIESYDNATGALTAWVKMPSVNGNSDTVLYLYYGNLTGEESDSVLVWSNGHQGVWHGGSSTTTPDWLDSTGNNQDGAMELYSEFGKEVTINSTSTTYLVSAVLSADKFVVAYRNVDTFGKAKICTVDDAIITCGNETEFNPASTQYISIAALSVDKFVVTYQDVGNSGYGTAVACTVSDTTIACGTETEFNSGNTQYIGVVDFDSSKFAVAYKDISNSNKGTVIACTVSDTTITCGDELVFNLGATSYVYADKFSSGAFVVAYRDEGNSNKGTAVACTVSGTTVACGDETLFNDGITIPSSVATLSSEKFLLSYQDSSNSNYGTVVICTVSGTVITCGSENVFYTGSFVTGPTTILSSDKFLISYRQVSTNFLEVVGCTVSGTTINCGTDTLFTYITSIAYSIISLSSEKFIINYTSYDYYYAAYTAKGIVGNVYPKATAGAGGNGVSFAPNLNRATVENSDIINVASTSPMTWEGWIKAEDGNSTSTLLTAHSLGGESIFNSGSTASTSATLLSSTTFAVAYQDNGNSGKGTVVICAVVGSTASCGAETVFNDANTADVSVAALSSTTFAIAYQDIGNSQKGITVICTVSGTVASCGAETIFNNASTAFISSSGLSTSTFAVAFQDAGNSSKGTAVVCIVSGTVASCGAETIFNDGITAYVASTALMPHRFAVAYQDIDDSSYGTVVGCSITGTSITCGTEVHVSTSYTSQYISITALTADKFVVAGNFSNVGRVIICRAPGTTVTCYNMMVFNYTTTGYGSAYHISVSAMSANKFIIAYHDESNSSYSTVSACYNYDADIVCSSETVFQSAAGEFFSAVGLSEDKFAVVYQDTADSSKGTALIGYTGGGEIGPLKSLPGVCYDGATATALSASKFVSVFETSSPSLSLQLVACETYGMNIICGTQITRSGNLEASVAALSSTTIAVAYKDNNSPYNGFAFACTISGTTITCGDSVTFNVASTSGVSVIGVSTSTFVTTYTDVGNSSKGTAVACTVSGTVVSCGSETVINNATTGVMSSVALSPYRFVSNYADGGNSNRGTSIICTVSGTTITYGSETVFNSGGNSTYISTTSLSADKFAVAYVDVANSNRGTVVACIASGTVISCGSETMLDSSLTISYA